VFLVALVLVSALAVPLAGGRLGALVELPLRRVWAIYAALGLAVLGVGVPGLPDGLHRICGSRLVPRWRGGPRA
jgi:hypothetical protein